jgi:hypothetical protein
MLAISSCPSSCSGHLSPFTNASQTCKCSKTQTPELRRRERRVPVADEEVQIILSESSPHRERTAYQQSIACRDNISATNSWHFASGYLECLWFSRKSEKGALGQTSDLITFFFNIVRVSNTTWRLKIRIFWSLLRRR